MRIANVIVRHTSHPPGGRVKLKIADEVNITGPIAYYEN